MDKIIIRDLTWSALESEKKAKENGLGAEQTMEGKPLKASHYWDNRMKPCEKMDYLVKKFDLFLNYNPEYLQNGVIQIAVSATKDAGAYRIGTEEYLEDVMVSLNPRRGLRFFVATLSEAQNCACTHRRFRRCLCANTYFLRIVNGNIHLDKLLGNDDWLYTDRIDNALEQVINLKGGTLLEDVPQWYKMTIDGTKDLCRGRFYIGTDEVKHVILCFSNSGSIIDEPAADIYLGEAIKQDGRPIDFNNQLIRFRIMNDKTVHRVDSDNPVYNHSLH